MSCLKLTSFQKLSKENKLLKEQVEETKLEINTKLLHVCLECLV